MNFEPVEELKNKKALVVDASFQLSMGRKKKDSGDGSKKKHKKNKHKKHHSIEDDVSFSGNDGLLGDIQRPIKLKIKLGDQLISSSNATIESPIQESTGADDASSPAESDSRSYGASISSVAGGVAEGGVLDITEGSEVGMPEEDVVESDVSVGREEAEADEVVTDGEENDEEEAWLVALETGEVNERGYLPQKVDVSSMTARQAETVRKLLEKQTTKKKDEEKTKHPVKKLLSVRHVRYMSSREGCTLSLPHGMDLPRLGGGSRSCDIPAVPVLCGVRGCKNVKKYSDSVTNTPLCSLACYKKLKSTGIARKHTQSKHIQPIAT